MLLDSYVVFNFTTQYMITHPKIAPADQYVFNDFDDFMKYVEANNYPFEIDSEKKLNELINSSKKDELYGAINNDLNSLKSKIIKEKKSVLLKHKQQICNFITRNILILNC